MAPYQQAGVFLISSLFDLYLTILLLRFLLQYLRVDYYNPLTQFIVKVTSPVVVPLRRLIPGFYGLDLATVAVILALSLLKIILIAAIALHKFPHPVGLLIWTLGDVLTLVLKLYFYAVLASVLLSWFAPQSHSPIVAILYRLTDPLLRPVKRLIPPIAGFDITPIPVILGLQIAIMLLASPLVQIGAQLATR